MRQPAGDQHHRHPFRNRLLHLCNPVAQPHGPPRAPPRPCPSSFASLPSLPCAAPQSCPLPLEYIANLNFLKDSWPKPEKVLISWPGRAGYVPAHEGQPICCPRIPSGIGSSPLQAARSAGSYQAHPPHRPDLRTPCRNRNAGSQVRERSACSQLIAAHLDSLFCPLTGSKLHRDLGPMVTGAMASCFLQASNRKALH